MKTTVYKDSITNEIMSNKLIEGVCAWDWSKNGEREIKYDAKYRNYSKDITIWAIVVQ